MSILFANNFSTTLAASITDSATSLTVADAAGAPTLSDGDYFPLTLQDTSGDIEIVYCTATDGTTFTVTRGEEGTTAIAFAKGAICELRNTAGALGAMLQATNIGTAITTWFSNLPTTLPDESGVLWNNGGVLSMS